MTGLLLDTKLDAEQQRLSETIRASGEILLALINDILDFSKIEAGRMELENQPFDLTQCVEESLDLVNPSAAEKGSKRLTRSKESCRGVSWGTSSRLRQILVNLLSNAVKFTEKGEVVVSLSGRRRATMRIRTPFCGPRHRPGNSARSPKPAVPILQSGRCLDQPAIRRNRPGPGHQQRLSELMGGRMWVESSGVPGEGATFHFTILAAKAPDQNLPDERRVRDAAILAGKRILIVDDNKTSRDILIAQTKRWAMLPTAVASGPEALELIRGGRRLRSGDSGHADARDGRADAGRRNRRVPRHPGDAGGLGFVRFASHERRARVLALRPG